MSMNTISVQTIRTGKTHWSARELCLAAVMTAVVFLATFVPRIPIPLGYAHLGDAAIFLLVLLLPSRPALLAACLGSALSDLLGGFALWILPTLLIKFVMGYLVLKLAQKDSSIPRTAIAFLLASLWMTAGYTLFGALLYASLSAGLASAPGLFLEGLINSGAALLLLPVLRRNIHL
ncbi:ECF transporter S component [Selenomonas caprae]|nr:ECF transporter S component [Selenomonas caprae]